MNRDDTAMISTPASIHVDEASPASARSARPLNPGQSRSTKRISASPMLSTLAIVLAGSLTLASDSARADERGSLFEDPTHWVVSGALELGVYGHTGKGNIRGTPLTGPRVANPSELEDLGPDVVEDLRSREQILSGLIGGTFELMSPQLTASMGRPRIFADLNVTSALAQEVGLARTGEPGAMGLPSPITPGNIVGEAAVVGRGAAVTVQPQGPQIHAGIGSAFALELPESVVRIKPSLVYSRTIVDISAVANRAVRLGTPQPGPFPDFDTAFRLIELSEGLTEVYHSLGPALEIEYEPGTRIGPFAITLYLKGHAARVIGDLKTKMVQTNPDPAAPGESVHFKYTQDPWAFRASTGIRLRWDPLRGR